MESPLKVHINVTDNFTPALRNALEKLKRGVEPTWRCEYCGNENTARKCIGCGAPRPMKERPSSGPALVDEGGLVAIPPLPGPDLMPKEIDSRSIIKDIFMGRSYKFVNEP